MPAVHLIKSRTSYRIVSSWQNRGLDSTFYQTTCEQSSYAITYSNPIKLERLPLVLAIFAG